MYIESGSYEHHYENENVNWASFLNFHILRRFKFVFQSLFNWRVEIMKCGDIWSTIYNIQFIIYASVVDVCQANRMDKCCLENKFVYWNKILAFAIVLILIIKFIDGILKQSTAVTNMETFEMRLIIRLRKLRLQRMLLRSTTKMMTIRSNSSKRNANPYTADPWEWTHKGNEKATGSILLL